MSKMWKGPCDTVKAACTDPIANRLHRRAGERQISYNIDDDGCSAEVFRLEKRRGDYVKIPLGAVRGDDAMNTYINVALEYTEHDAELISLIARNIANRTDDVAETIANLGKQLDGALEDIGEAHAALAARYD